MNGKLVWMMDEEMKFELFHFSNGVMLVWLLMSTAITP
jgi:hypothetical protein